MPATAKCWHTSMNPPPPKRKRRRKKRKKVSSSFERHRRKCDGRYPGKQQQREGIQVFCVGSGPASGRERPVGEAYSGASVRIARLPYLLVLIAAATGGALRA